MVITEEIRQAIIAAIEQSGSALSFARSVGVSHTTVAYWLKGRTRKINATIWNNLLPLIGGYLGDAATGPEQAYHYPPLTSSSQPRYVMRERPAVPSFYDEPSPDLSSAPLFYFSDLFEISPAVIFSGGRSLIFSPRGSFPRMRPCIKPSIIGPPSPCLQELLSETHQKPSQTRSHLLKRASKRTQSNRKEYIYGRK